MNVSTLIKFDLMELPGAACIWESYSYSVKAYVKLATPIIVALFLAIPVGVAWLAARRDANRKHNRSSQESLDASQEINWRQRYERTLDVFWNNVNP